jgi:predicted MPP superfamily phosphohydrolase
VAAFFMSLIIDLLAISSIAGIWPRYIEPRRLQVTHLEWELEKKWAHLAGIKIAHITDLHFHTQTSKLFLNKILKTINKQKPDIILFTGDFLCYSQLEAPERLSYFLSELEAPLGSYCVFGNHDYASYVSLTRSGVYDTIPPPKPLAGLYRGIYTLFSNLRTGSQVTERARSIALHDSLCRLLANTPFKLLDNATATLPVGLNLTGLGDISVGRCLPEKAFVLYDRKFPGIVLSHNPDSLPKLLAYPGDWILCGHTHGEQIHIPWPKWGRKLSQKLARLENSAYTRGLFQIKGKRLYVNRGLGGHKPFRLFSPPELCLIHTIKKYD